MSSDAKIKVQSFGRFLSNMVMPNIGAFIAWGFITALFIPTGWYPNATLAKLVGPMITYLLPLLIGYTGGKIVAGDRGAVVGAITTMGVIVGSDIPMFMGAMFAGPLGGYVIKKFDQAVDGKVKSGFEMLVNNFSAGILGMICALIAFFVIGPMVDMITHFLVICVNFLVAHDLLPLTSIFVEPAKVLFLNNAINHGIFTPLGLQQVQEHGKSIFFLIEANPGAGLGILLAFSLFGTGTAKSSAPGAAIIHFFGGIHEIYFPYILMMPRLAIAAMCGGMTGVFTLSMFGAGLVAPASPGSIFAVLMMTPPGNFLGVISAVVADTIVTFIVATFLLKTAGNKGEEESLEEASAKMKDMKATSKGQESNMANLGSVNKIIVACDAGMGSSAMGASMLRKKVQKAGLDISVTNLAINNLPSDVDIVVTHKDLTPRAQKQVPGARHISLTNFLDGKLYDDLVSELVAAKSAPASTVAPVEEEKSDSVFKLDASCVFLGLKADNKQEAIRFAGEQVVKAGFAEQAYADSMFDREKLVSTYLGEGIAVPHGTIEAKDKVIKTGIVFCQYPEGVRFTDDEDDGVAKLVIGIAAQGDEHIHVITAITNALDDESAMETLKTTKDVNKVLEIINA